MNQRSNHSKLLKLELANQQYLKSVRKALTNRYGVNLCNRIVMDSLKNYFLLIPFIPYVSIPVFNRISLHLSYMISLKKAMHTHNLGIKEYVNFSVNTLKNSTTKQKLCFRRISYNLNTFLIYHRYSKEILIKSNESYDSKSRKEVNSYFKSNAKSELINFIKSLDENDLLPYFNHFVKVLFSSYGIKIES